LKKFINRYDIGSLSGNYEKDDNGSLTLYLGLKAPKGLEAN